MITKIQAIIDRKGNNFGDLKAKFLATDGKIYVCTRYEGEHHELSVGKPLPYDAQYLYKESPETLEEKIEYFTDYFNSFYGPEGLYPKSKKDFSLKEVRTVIEEVFRDNLDDFCGDTFDRERLYEHIIKFKKSLI